MRVYASQTARRTRFLKGASTGAGVAPPPTTAPPAAQAEERAPLLPPPELVVARVLGLHTALRSLTSALAPQAGVASTALAYQHIPALNEGAIVSALLLLADFPYLTVFEAVRRAFPYHLFVSNTEAADKLAPIISALFEPYELAAPASAAAATPSAASPKPLTMRLPYPTVPVAYVPAGVEPGSDAYLTASTTPLGFPCQGFVGMAFGDYSGPFTAAPRAAPAAPIAAAAVAGAPPAAAKDGPKHGAWDLPKGLPATVLLRPLSDELGAEGKGAGSSASERALAVHTFGGSALEEEAADVTARGREPTLMAPYVRAALAMMVQSHSIGRDLCVVGARGEGKSFLVKQFAKLLGYAPVETMFLYKVRHGGLRAGQVCCVGCGGLCSLLALPPPLYFSRTCLLATCSNVARPHRKEKPSGESQRLPRRSDTVRRGLQGGGGW